MKLTITAKRGLVLNYSLCPLKCPVEKSPEGQMYKSSITNEERLYLTWKKSFQIFDRKSENVTTIKFCQPLCSNPLSYRRLQLYSPFASEVPPIHYMLKHVPHLLEEKDSMQNDSNTDDNRM